MHFRHPFEAIAFDVPDAWLTAAGAVGFRPAAPAFAATSAPAWPTVQLALTEVEAPRRDAGVAGLREERAISILRAMVDGHALPPLEVHRRPTETTRVAVRDGYHRYYLSIALGYTMVPVSIRPYFEFDAR